MQHPAHVVIRVMTFNETSLISFEQEGEVHFPVVRQLSLKQFLTFNGYDKRHIPQAVCPFSKK